MPIQQLTKRCLLLALFAVATAPLAEADSLKPGPIKVFLLAGQSNMEGQGVVDLDHPDYYNGGKGILNRVISEAKGDEAKRYARVKDSAGKYIEREDVRIRFEVKSGTKKGKLTIGYTGYDGSHHIGPEFQFGHLVGDAIDQPVLLIKTAWGGKSLFKDFRPPSAGGETGPYYKQMISEIEDALKSIGNDFPDLKGRPHEIAGFVWFQGWNDMFDEKALAGYEDNLVHLIKDVRKHFNLPNLPVVVGELGNGGDKNVGKNMLKIREAQARAATRPEWKGSVGFVKTTPFARPKEESPNVGHGHHWFGNAESYFLIGDALGKEMLRLLNREK